MKKTLGIICLAFASLSAFAVEEPKTCFNERDFMAIDTKVYTCSGEKWIYIGEQKTRTVNIGFELKTKNEVVSTGNLQTLDFKPATVQSGKTTSYLASAIRDSKKDGIELVPGSVFSGFRMTLFPSIQNDGRLVMQGYFAQSDVLSIKTITLGTDGLSIQVPDTKSSSQSFTFTLNEGGSPAQEIPMTAIDGKPMLLKINVIAM